MNIEIPNKEYILQHTKRGWRCISWHPHYIMTNWVKSKDVALQNGDNTIKNFYKKIKSSYGSHEYFEGDSFSICGIYNKDMDYKDVKYNTFFETKEDCQKYCNWFNNKK